MVPDTTIRRATEDDIPAIQRVARTSWREAYGEFMPEEVIDEMLAYGYSVDFLEEAISDTDVTIFVAQDEYSVVGYVSCEPPAEGDTGQVSIYVSPDYWGEGIGTELLERAEAYLAEKGARSLQDVVLAANDVGNAFYGKHFEQTDETTVEMGDEEFDANVYTATLEPR
jgi:ribosomal protein S18 acetylase RimI-like enzyme